MWSEVVALWEGTDAISLHARAPEHIMAGAPEFLCVCCAHCRMFQCTQRRKDRRFVCVVCHTKQSVVRIFGVSARAADIRALVQKYNMAGATAASSNTAAGCDDEPEREEEEVADDQEEEEEEQQVDKWAPFLVEDKKTPGAAEDPAGGLAGRLAAAAERRERAAGGGGPSREPASRARVVRSGSSRGTAEPYTVAPDDDGDFEAPPPAPAPHAPATTTAAASKWARFL